MNEHKTKLFIDSMGCAEYMRFIAYQKHLIKAIDNLFVKYQLPKFEQLPIDYNDIQMLYDDIMRMSKCPESLYHWRSIRNADN